MSGVFTVLIALGLGLGLWLWQPAQNVDDRREQSQYTLALIAHAQDRGYLKRDDPTVEAKAKLKWMFELTPHSNSPLARALGENDLLRLAGEHELSREPVTTALRGIWGCCSWQCKEMF